MSAHDHSSMAEPAPIVLYNDPLLLRPNQCPFFTDMLPGRLIFERKLLQLTDQVSGNFPTSPPEALSFRFGHDTGNRIMDIFYKNSPRDQPEFVDVDQLTLSETSTGRPVDDDDGDVVFVKEYQRQPETDQKANRGLRRNPVRKARNTKGVMHLLSEHLLEEDFAFLDQFDEDNLVLCKGRPLKEPFKSWPVNVFERPEYNPQTNEVEPLDYIIRDIENKQLKKKRKLEAGSRAKTKPKKKYVIRKRKPKSKKPVETVAAKELSDVVGTTMLMVKNLLRGVVEGPLCSSDLLKNQTAMMVLVNNHSKEEVAGCITQLLSES